jgi:hypothetical protein
MAIYTLYGGEVTLKFDGRKHVYTLENERCKDGSALMVAGVTSILKRLAKEALVPWASGMAADYFRDSLLAGYDETNPEEQITFTVAEIDAIAKDARKAYAKKAKGAADVGKLVHAYAESFLRGNKNPDRPSKTMTPEERAQYDNGVSAFQKWWKANDVEVIASERVLFSKRWVYAGTTDLVARINGKKAVGDFKTSSGLYPEMAIQLAAYRIALEEEDGETYPWGALIHLDKTTGNYNMKMIPRNKQDEDCFLSLRECDEVMKRIQKAW